MWIGEREMMLRPGETVHVPRGVVHRGRNSGAGEGRRLLVFSPAGIESFFTETGTAMPDIAIDQVEALASAARHGWVLTGK